MAREVKATKSVKEDYSGVVFTFAHDDSVLEVNVADLPDEIKYALLCHGIAQKIGDSYASVDAGQARTAAEAVFEALKGGKWTQRTEGSSGPKTSQLAEALADVTGRELDECVVKIATMSDDEKKALRAHPQVAAAMAAIKLQKAQAAAAKAAEEAAAAGEAGALTF